MYNTNFGNPTSSFGVMPCSNKVEQGAFFSVEGGYMVAGEYESGCGTLKLLWLTARLVRLLLCGCGAVCNLVCVVQP